jgi:site-specific DNA-methyltransferase (adenine-specific)
MLTERGSESFFGGRVELCCGDGIHFLRDQPADRYHSIVTDPPYALVFMGKQWDTGITVHAVEFWAECLRVLKPGGHVVAFSGTRTYHRMACAIEDAGFEIRDQLQWLYGSGFPKSHDVSKGIDRAAGAEREVVGKYKDPRDGYEWHDGTSDGTFTAQHSNPSRLITAPATDAAIQWQGWGTALKPAAEPICFARKPLSEKTVAQNVLAHGTGAINVDGCRIAGEPWTRDNTKGNAEMYDGWRMKPNVKSNESGGRWPANIIHDGSDEVVGMFPETESGQLLTHHKRTGQQNIGTFAIRDRTGEESNHGGDSGSAARFFYTAKADANDRIGSKHPTVKPIDLMCWLVRLVTPKGGLVLDPFAGTGTTGEACIREGMRCMLVEREAEYQADIRRRMALVMAGQDERARESIKEKLKNQPIDHGPLFRGKAAGC